MDELINEGNWELSNDPKRETVRRYRIRITKFTVKSSVRTPQNKSTRQKNMKNFTSIKDENSKE